MSSAITLCLALLLSAQCMLFGANHPSIDTALCVIQDREFAQLDAEARTDSLPPAPVLDSAVKPDRSGEHTFKANSGVLAIGIYGPSVALCIAPYNTSMLGLFASIGAGIAAGYVVPYHIRDNDEVTQADAAAMYGGTIFGSYAATMIGLSASPNGIDDIRMLGLGAIAGGLIGSEIGYRMVRHTNLEEGRIAATMSMVTDATVLYLCSINAAEPEWSNTPYMIPATLLGTSLLSIPIAWHLSSTQHLTPGDAAAMSLPSYIGGALGFGAGVLIQNQVQFSGFENELTKTTYLSTAIGWAVGSVAGWMAIRNRELSTTSFQHIAIASIAGASLGVMAATATTQTKHRVLFSAIGAALGYAISSILVSDSPSLPTSEKRDSRSSMSIELHPQNLAQPSAPYPNIALYRPLASLQLMF